LRILQSGEFYKVGSSKVQKTDVRIVAATNKNLLHMIRTGKFREDLYYRLNTVPISIPALRERKNDIYLLFRKFALDFADKYKMPTIRLNHDAQVMLQNYRWPGNIRQLKNVAEQISVLESTRDIDVSTLQRYLPVDTPESLPVLNSQSSQQSDFISDRDLFYKILLQQKQELAELKAELERFKNQSVQQPVPEEHYQPVPIINQTHQPVVQVTHQGIVKQEDEYADYSAVDAMEREEQDTLSIPNLSNELIRKCLEKHNGKRREAAIELGISERTLYRKIKAFAKEEESDK
jgi:DNA-binding NtrC family response regulator